MMMMEEDAEETEQFFVAHEIDLAYEFDAPHFFDFTKPESPSQSQQAQLWFQNAPTYPPSPFVTRLMMTEELSLDSVSDSSNSHHVEYDTSNVADFGDDDEKSSVLLGPKFSKKYFENNDSKALGRKIKGMLNGILQNDAMQKVQVPTGLTVWSKKICDSLNSKAKSAVRKSSTLMKPTASQLAKQNRPPKSVGSRFPKQLSQNEMNLSISSEVETQAAKRQKLEGGLLCKANDVKQQTNFLHKAPKRAIVAAQNFASSKLRLTVPREPDLRTAHRAQRIRSKDVADAEHVTMAVPRFKARPLNRKILDAPSTPIPKRSTPQLPEFQEFHLKTEERAMQQAFATSPSSLHCNDSDKGLDKHAAVSVLDIKIRDLRRPSAMSAPKYDGLSFTHNLKSRPLNKTILKSKEDIGVINRKQETTEPMESNLYTEKGVQHNPPIELFSKLSLTSKVQPNNGSHLKPPQHSGMFRKGKPLLFGAKQIHHGNGGCISEAGTRLSASRGLGIR
ncbi:hypothetical protein TanjilG_32266 [Lupinus angustifolius]|uniref:TPX2 central domain-containing protein n=2 Tax=Lupinus angustifolius TaxID=3871 RepID=A0A4P1RF31_LUPAN|nr:hypothetical protein TanjilG_32266 [Lupinus angustifolius]